MIAQQQFRALRSVPATGTCVALVCLIAVTACGDLHPKALRTSLKSGERPMLVDVRASASYKAGHIPGAMNVPLSMIEYHRFTGSEWIVVYDAGLGGGEASRASALLRTRTARPRVDVLSGGYTAWLSAGGTTTEARGFRPERLPGISYDDLKKSKQGDIRLVDMRTMAPEALTDLATAFPGRRSEKWSSDVLRKERQAQNEVSPMLVLVDNGDGRAAKMARVLRANGNHRVVVLLGGEKMLKRQGRTGLQRLGPGAGIIEDEPTDEGGMP